MKINENKDLKGRNIKKKKKRISIITVFLWIFLVTMMITIVGVNIKNTNALEEEIILGEPNATKSAFEKAYNLRENDICYGIVELNGENIIDSGIPNVWPSEEFEASVNVIGYNKVEMYNTDPDVATALYKTNGGELNITFIPGTSNGTTKIEFLVDAIYSHYALGTWSMSLKFEYTVINGKSSVVGTELYSVPISVTYDLNTGLAVWGKNAYDGIYGNRSKVVVAITNKVEISNPYYHYYFSFYVDEMLEIAVGNYDTSIATVKAYEVQKKAYEADDLGNTIEKNVGISVTGLKKGTTQVLITPKFKIPTYDGKSVDLIERTMPIVLNIKVEGEIIEHNYELIYNANGGTAGEGKKAITKWSYNERSVANIVDFTIRDAEPTLKGYTFLGWADSKDAKTVQYLKGDKITLTEYFPTKTLYAVWKKSSGDTDLKTKLVGTKIWEDNENFAKKRPNSVILQVIANEEVITEHEVNEANNWSYEFELAKYDELGNEIDYYIDERNNDNKFYKKILTDKNTVTNEFVVPEEVVLVNAVKKWEDNNDEYSKRPRSVVLQVYNGDKLISEEEVSKNNNWSYEFKLPKYDELGDEISYTVDEKYTSKYYEKSVEGYTVINKCIYEPAVDTSDMNIFIYVVIFFIAIIVAIVGIVFIKNKKK